LRKLRLRCAPSDYLFHNVPFFVAPCPLLCKAAPCLCFNTQPGPKRLYAAPPALRWYNRRDCPFRLLVALDQFPTQESHVRTADTHSPADRRAADYDSRGGIDHAPGVDPVALPALWQRGSGVGLPDRLQRQVPPASACATRA